MHLAVAGPVKKVQVVAAFVVVNGGVPALGLGVGNRVAGGVRSGVYPQVGTTDGDELFQPLLAQR